MLARRQDGAVHAGPPDATEHDIDRLSPEQVFGRLGQLGHADVEPRRDGRGAERNPNDRSVFDDQHPRAADAVVDGNLRRVDRDQPARGRLDSVVDRGAGLWAAGGERVTPDDDAGSWDAARPQERAGTRWASSWASLYLSGPRPATSLNQGSRGRFGPRRAWPAVGQGRAASDGRRLVGQADQRDDVEASSAVGPVPTASSSR